MALHPCAECGRDVSTKAVACPNCGAPQESAPLQSDGGKKGRGCGTWLLILLAPLVAAGVYSSCQQQKDEAARRRAKAEFARSLDDHYTRLVALSQEKSWSEAVRLARQFESHGLLGHRDARSLWREASIEELRHKVATTPGDAWDQRHSLLVRLQEMLPQDDSVRDELASVVKLIRERDAQQKAEADRKKREAAERGDVHGAWAYMQLFVEKRLKSPKSADFRFGGYRDVTPLGGHRYRVDSYVDAQNSFGAEIRTRFRGVIRRVEGGWELEDLTFDD